MERRAANNGVGSEAAGSLKLVSTGQGFSALIKHRKTVIQIEGDDFAITNGE
jgi:hypothetical protein